MISLNLSYNDIIHGAQMYGEEWAVDQLSLALNSTLGLRRGGQYAIFGSSWTGQIMYKVVEQLNLGEMFLIIENRLPCKELEHLPHVRANKCGPELDRADHLIIATSPEHYSNIIQQLDDELLSDKIILPYAKQQSGFSVIDTPLINLPVFIRVSNVKVIETTIPVAPAYTALILIDIWDEGQVRCPYCDVIPGLLSTARKHELLRVHAPTLALQNGTIAFQRQKSNVPLNAFQPGSWPPSNFRMRQNNFEHLNAHSPLYGEGSPTPLGIHSCARPVGSKREHVVNDQETLLDLFEKHRILHVLYCGGGTLACLAFKPCGYLNILKAGYFPILIEDATHQKPRRFRGRNLDMVEPGIVTFQDRGGYTTTSDQLHKAFAAQRLSSKNENGTCP